LQHIHSVKAGLSNPLLPQRITKIAESESAVGINLQQ